MNVMVVTLGTSALKSVVSYCRCEGLDYWIVDHGNAVSVNDAGTFDIRTLSLYGKVYVND